MQLLMLTHPRGGDRHHDSGESWRRCRSSMGGYTKGIIVDDVKQLEVQLHRSL
jgi:hypothetical protein